MEISCHGGTLVSAKVLEACLRAGARAARPGEFTERAFLNGKMDLTQAEAVIDLIRARTDLALRSATEQLEGRLGDQIRKIRDELIALLAHINASIDFPEEGIEPDEDETLCARLDSVRDETAVLLATADQGRVLREGVRVVIYGATNAGKSSLLNRLLGYDRVIVSDTHGTTRDTIEETVNLEGVPIRLLDTAGLRASESELEREGIARTQRSLHLADLRLHIADRSAPKPAHFKGATSDRNGIVVLNREGFARGHGLEGFPRVANFVRDRRRTATTETGNSGTHSPAKFESGSRDCDRSLAIAIVFVAPWNCHRATRRWTRDYPANTLQLILIKRCAQSAKSSALWM